MFWKYRTTSLEFVDGTMFYGVTTTEAWKRIKKILVDDTLKRYNKADL